MVDAQDMSYGAYEGLILQQMSIRYCQLIRMAGLLETSLRYRPYINRWQSICYYIEFKHSADCSELGYQSNLIFDDGIATNRHRLRYLTLADILQRQFKNSELSTIHGKPIATDLAEENSLLRRSDQGASQMEANTCLV